MTAAPTVGVLSVATNRYVEYWMQLAASVDQHFFPGHEVTLHVFTDRAADVAAFAPTLDRVRVNAVEIDALAWPEATLLRYEVFDRHRDQLDQDVLVHLDADMLLAADVGVDLRPDDWRNGICLVRHPGYRRPTGRALASLYAQHPGIAIRDLYSEARYGGIGRWETDATSRAYVPRHDRKTYVCGGTWFGRHDPFLAMVHELADNTRHDLDRGKIAVWHDESHLNAFRSRTDTALLDSDYCFAEGLPGLADLTPRIIAVDKSDDRTR
jgi:hypothetical protein